MEGLVVSEGAFAGSGLHFGMAVGHHDDHRLGLALGDQVVHDLAGASEYDPLVLVAAAAVKQVEHGIALVAVLIAVGGVDVHAPVLAYAVGVVPARGEGSVGDVLHGVEVSLSAAYEEHVVHGSEVTVYVGVVGVDGGDAVNHEHIAVELGLQRLGGVFPEAVLALDHVDEPGSDHASDGVVGHHVGEVTGYLHAVRLGGDETEGHRIVGVHDGGLDVLGDEEVLLGGKLSPGQRRRKRGDKDEFFHEYLAI